MAGLSPELVSGAIHAAIPAPEPLKKIAVAPALMMPDEAINSAPQVETWKYLFFTSAGVVGAIALAVVLALGLYYVSKLVEIVDTIKSTVKSVGNDLTESLDSLNKITRNLETPLEDLTDVLEDL